jgi:putative heme iron utilization protein
VLGSDAKQQSENYIQCLSNKKVFLQAVSWKDESFLGVEDGVLAFISYDGNYIFMVFISRGVEDNSSLPVGFRVFKNFTP